MLYTCNSEARNLAFTALIAKYVGRAHGSYSESVPFISTTLFFRRSASKGHTYLKFQRKIYPDLRCLQDSEDCCKLTYISESGLAFAPSVFIRLMGSQHAQIHHVIYVIIRKTQCNVEQVSVDNHANESKPAEA